MGFYEADLSGFRRMDDGDFFVKICPPWLLRASIEFGCYCGADFCTILVERFYDASESQEPNWEQFVLQRYDKGVTEALPTRISMAESTSVTSSPSLAKKVTSDDVQALRQHCEALGVSVEDLIHITEDEMTEMSFGLKEKLVVRKLKANLEIIKAEAARQQVIHQHVEQGGHGGKSMAEIRSDNAGHAVEAAKLGWDIVSKFV